MTRLRELLAAAERDVPRLDPAAAATALEAGAALVDIRSSAARARDGVVPGSVHVTLTVLHWRLDPEGEWRTPHVPPGAPVVLLCDHGCSSLLAAASLRELGVDASDVRGGYAAWSEAGLPCTTADDAPLGPGELQGMRGPEPR